MEIVFNSLILNGDLHTLKLAALYCDKIILPDGQSGLVGMLEGPDENMRGTGKAVAVWKTIPESLKDEVSLLTAAGLLEVSSHADHEVIEQGEFLDTFEHLQDSFFRKDLATGGLVNRYDELALIALGYSPTIEITDDFEQFYSRYALVESYFTSFSEILLCESIYHQAPILTDSPVINELMLKFLDSERVNTSHNLSEHRLAFLTQRVLQEYLPNIQDVPMDAVLEVREKLESDLDAFRHAMARFLTETKANPWSDELQREIESIITTKVKPAVHELNRAITRSGSRTIQRVFENLKNPGTYVPLVGTAMSGIPPSVAMLASIGIAGFKALHDTFIERQDLTDKSGLVFLLKAPKRIRSKGRRR